MKEWLSKEYVIKRKRGGIVLEVILDSVLLSLIFYYILAECSNFLISFFNEVVRNGLILDMILILFPIVLVVCAISKIMYYRSYANRSEPVKVNSKKTVKKTKKR